MVCVFQAMFILYEHASGYALFKVKEFEEMGMLLPEVEKGVSDLSKFNQVVNLSAFSPFKSGTNALDNINSISEGKFVFSLICSRQKRKKTISTFW